MVKCFGLIDSDVYIAWKETLIEILGETATKHIEEKVIEKLGPYKKMEIAS